jgi:hypothetical protein
MYLDSPSLAASLESKNSAALLRVSSFRNSGELPGFVAAQATNTLALGSSTAVPPLLPVYDVAL